MQVDKATRPTESKGPRLHPRHAGIAATGFLLLAVLILLPAGCINFARQSFLSKAQRTYVISQPTRSTAPDGQGQRLQLTLEGMIPWENTVRVRVLGQRPCEPSCVPARIAIAAIPSDIGSSNDGGPLATVDVINLPAGVADVDQTLTLPIDGEWLEYPFDKYVLTLGFDELIARPDGTYEREANAASQNMTITLAERLTDFQLQQPQRLDPSAVTRGGAQPYAVASRITIVRPFYDEAETIVVVLLAVAAAAYGVFMRPFRELAIGATGLTLSLWGVRSLLMGNQPGTTTVDFVLIGVIIFVLSGITARVLIALIQGKEAQ